MLFGITRSLVSGLTYHFPSSPLVLVSPLPPPTPTFAPKQLRIPQAGLAQGLVMQYPGLALGGLGAGLAQAYYYGAAAATAAPYGLGLDQVTLKDLIKKQM